MIVILQADYTEGESDTYKGISIQHNEKGCMGFVATTGDINQDLELASQKCLELGAKHVMVSSSILWCHLS